MTWPKEYGGHERTAMERYAVTEELLAAGAPVAAHWIADRQSGPNLLRYGTETQRKEILPRIAAGECFFVIGMSEPDSGSDLASIRTKAVRNADGDWVVDGAKVWTSNAHHSHYAIVLVRTAPADPTARHAGMSQLLVDLSLPGITINPIRILDGGHHFNEVVFDSVVVPGTCCWARRARAGTRSPPSWPSSAAARSGSCPPSRCCRLRAPGVHRRRARHPGPVVGPAAGAAPAVDPDRRRAGPRELPDIPAALVKDVGTTFEADVAEEIRRVVDVPASLDSPDPLGRALAEAQLHQPGYTLRGGTNEILRGIVARGLGLR